MSRQGVLSWSAAVCAVAVCGLVAAVAVVAADGHGEVHRRHRGRTSTSYEHEVARDRGRTSASYEHEVSRGRGRTSASYEHEVARDKARTSASYEHEEAQDRSIDSDEQGSPYQFHYEVDAPQYGTWYDRHESSSGHTTEGRFRVALPDHRLQTVTYQATQKDGFQADVQFEQHPDFNSLRGNIGKAPVIGAPVVSVYKSEETAHFETTKLRPHQPSFGYQTPVGNKYGDRRRPTPSKIPKITRRPLSLSHSKGGFRRPTSSSRRQSTSRPTYASVHQITSTPLSAFVSIAAIQNHVTLKPLRITRPVATYTFSKLLTSPRPTVTKKVVPSRPLRNKQRSTFKPSTPDGGTRAPHRFSSVTQKNTPSFGDKKLSEPLRFRPVVTKRPIKPLSVIQPSSSKPKEIPVSHVPDKKDPEENVEPPATTDKTFSVAGKATRYSIRKEGMNSVRSRLNSIVHD